MTGYTVHVDIIQEPSHVTQEPSHVTQELSPAAADTSVVLRRPAPVALRNNPTSTPTTAPPRSPNHVQSLRCHDSVERTADKHDSHDKHAAHTPLHPSTVPVLPTSVDLTLQRSISAPSAATRRHSLAPSAERPAVGKPRANRRAGTRWFAFEADRLSPPARRLPLRGKVVVLDTTPLRKARAELKADSPEFEDESPAETEAYLAHVTKVLHELGAR